METTMTENRDSRTATFRIPGTHSQIVIDVCDIFDQKGPKVIHCHNTFDTDDEVMRETSVMGQFIKLCKEKGVDLNRHIDEWIAKHQHKGVEMDNLPCRKYMFEIGEICPINVDGEHYLLTAFENLSHFMETGAMEMDSYLCFLDSLWNSLVKAGIDNSCVNIPAFGNKLVNISNNGFTVDQRIGLIIQSYFKAIRNNRLYETLHICIHESDAHKIDFSNWQEVLLPYLYQFCQLHLGLKTLPSKSNGLFAGIRKSLKSNVTKAGDVAVNGVKQVFISHSKDDCEEGDIVYEYLESKGYRCWMDTHDITPGIPYAKEIMAGFKNSCAVVVIVSKNSIHSIGVQNEIDNVYKNNKIIIPFRIDDTPLSDELSFYLSSTQWINAFPRFEDHLDDLGKALEQLLR